MADDDFLARWSRRKIGARRGEALEEPEPPKPVPEPPSQPPAAAGAAAPAPPAAPELPSVESLTADSDFAPFMQAGVDPLLRRQALKKLLHDPRFNVMDGLDVYIDDFSKPDPLPEGWLEKLNQVARLGDYKPPLPEEAPKPAEAAEAPAAQVADAPQPDANATENVEGEAHADGVISPQP